MTALLPPRRPVHVYRVQVRWADYDLNQHVNNAAYFTYCEQARIDWLQQIHMQDTDAGEGPVVVQASCNYRMPIARIETLDVRVAVGPPGRTSFTTYYDIAAADGTEAIYADGQAVMVWTHRGDGRPRPLPDALRTLLAQD